MLAGWEGKGMLGGEVVDGLGGLVEVGWEAWEGRCWMGGEVRVGWEDR